MKSNKRNATMSRFHVSLENYKTRLRTWSFCTIADDTYRHKTTTGNQVFVSFL